MGQTPGGVWRMVCWSVHVKKSIGKEGELVYCGLRYAPQGGGKRRVAFDGLMV